MQEGEFMEEKVIENNTKKILNDLNIKINIKGYQYWRETVKYIILNNKVEYRMTKDVYIDVSRKMNTTSSRFEKALRDSIKGREMQIQKYFNINYSIKNSTFIALLISKIKEECEM